MSNAKLKRQQAMRANRQRKEKKQIVQGLQIAITKGSNKNLPKLPDEPATITTTAITSTMKWQSKKIKTTLAQY